MSCMELSCSLWVASSRRLVDESATPDVALLSEVTYKVTHNITVSTPRAQLLSLIGGHMLVLRIGPSLKLNVNITDLR